MTFWKTPEPITGGCLCGRTRYRARRPFVRPHYCHCHQCRHAVGNVVISLVAFDWDDLEWTGPEPARWRSSEHAQRGFCPDCGTPLTFEGVYESEIAITMGSLDDVASAVPDYHWYMAEKVAWFHTVDDAWVGDPRWADEEEARSLLTRPYTRPPLKLPLTGGCACGAVRYAVDAAPETPHYCHCSICRRAGGNLFLTFFMAPFERIVWSGTAPSRYRSSPGAQRGFCGDCGTPLTFERDDRPETLALTIGSLDDPDAVAPERHLCADTMVHWLRIYDGLPRFHADGHQLS